MHSHLIRNARLVALAEHDQVPDHPVDVLVRDGVVSQVGESLPGESGVPEVAAAGRWLIPGLWDQHVHFAQWTLMRARLDLTATRSPQDVLTAVQARVAAAPGTSVVGWGHRSGGWEREVTVTELDAVTGETPVVLISGDGHHAWANSIALRMLGLPNDDTVVAEYVWFDAYPRLGSVLGEDGSSPAAYRSSLAAAAAMGVTGVVDFEFGGSVQDWAERWAAGADLLRVRVATYAEGLDAVIAAGLRHGDPLPGLSGADGLASVGPLKIISDGSLNTRTAWCCQPYADGDRLAHPYGQPNLDAAALVELLQRAHRAGLQVATHAIGDAALAQALSAYAESGARGSIEHAQLVTRADVRQMATLGIRASVQPAHLLDDRDPTEKLWPDRTERCFAFRWMLQDGVEVALGSDAPVSPLDPWLAIAAAVHRSADDRDPWHAEQALTPREALAASVDGQGTVRVGSRGDLVLLDADPLVSEREASDTAGASAALRGMQVAATWVAGRLVHSTLD